MANFVQWAMGVNSLLSNNKITPEIWDFRDKQGGSIFGNVKVIDIGIDDNGSAVSQPVEENSFFSYNKTSEPQQIQCTLCFEGTVQYLQSSLNIVKRYKKGMDLISIVTPYAEYENMTLESFSHTRDVTNGCGLLYVKCAFREIEQVQVAYSQTDVSELPPPINPITGNSTIQCFRNSTSPFPNFDISGVTSLNIGTRLIFITLVTSFSATSKSLAISTSRCV